MDQFAAIDPAQAWDQLGRLIADPYSNMPAALALLAVVVIAVLIVAVIVIAAVTGRRPRQSARALEIAELRRLIAMLDGEPIPEEPEEAEPEREPYPWLLAIGVVSTGLLLVGISLGVTTSSPAVCAGCHVSTPHNDAVKGGASDAHVAVQCVECHEASGRLGSATIEVPGRMAHFFNGLRNDPKPTQYGAVVSAPCRRCHDSIDEKTTVDEERGVRMAHKQPLDAGAQCRDCHTIAATGLVSSVTVGMTPCLRCHDGTKQSAECALCHVKDIGAATQPHVNPADLKGRKIVDTPDCGSCHDEKVSCDPCHGGNRMPHTQLFMAYGHAREGAKDVWFNGGKRCGTCHSAERRPCTGCHTFFPGHPVDVWPKLHGASGATGYCDGCHGEKAHTAKRDFCGLCHSKPYVTQ